MEIQVGIIKYYTVYNKKGDSKETRVYNTL